MVEVMKRETVKFSNTGRQNSDVQCLKILNTQENVVTYFILMEIEVDSLFKISPMPSHICAGKSTCNYISDLPYLCMYKPHACISRTQIFRSRIWK
jgi:hypothetical protein